MRLVPDRVEVQAADPAAIAVDWSATAAGLDWSVANRDDRAVAVDAVAVVWRVEGAAAPLRMLRHGYQSWSATDVATLGVDEDPSRTPGAPSLVVAMHHADPARAEPGELRSELVTAVRDAGGAVVVAGFLGGAEHDGTFRLRTGADGAAELRAEAFLGGALLAGGEARPLHPVRLAEGEGDPAELLEAWAAAAGAAARARTAAPYQVGWCSWYHYFWHVTEADLRANLARAGDWPFEVVQLDDGYQAAIGDWLATNDDFPSDLGGIAGAIAATGATPGLWLAPFVAGPGSAVAAAHPDWFATHRPGVRLAGMVNPGWVPYGAERNGVVHTLDTTNPAVLEHLTAVAAAVVEAGFPYLKLDFTYAPSLPGGYADPTRTPAQRVRAGYDAIRRGAGDGAFLLGCGAPLGATIGAVDGMRIGPDVAPWWDQPPGELRLPGYEPTQPATAHAWRATTRRSFLHRRLWLNDPDCVMLRTEQTAMGTDAARRWALEVGRSGGMALVSDDLTLLDGGARALFDEVVALGRAADATAGAPGGHPPRWPDPFA